jgi:ketosteroid isomerase-like protein
MMKKITTVIAILLIAGANSFSQKKNGTVFIEHDAINTTKALWAAFVNGDEATYRSYFADSAYFIQNGSDPEAQANAEIGIGLKSFTENYENIKVEDQPPAFPDALEYKDGGTWVQDWLIMTGTHKESGINLNLPMHNLYSFNDEGKIVVMVMYFNDDVFEEINNSTRKRENGKVYINHPYIATVRKAENAAIAGDVETWKTYFSPDAKFSDSSMKLGETHSLEEQAEGLASWASMGLKTKIEQVGYPDCIYYEKNDIYVVYSWWKMTVVKDGKSREIPYLMTSDFDKDGKIVREHVYVSSNHMEGLF